MSFADDFINEYEWDDPRPMWDYYTDYWVTKEGKKIPIVEMETSHIKNVLKYIARHPQVVDGELPPIYHKLRAELDFREWEK